jgi:ribosomal protein S12
MEKRSFGMGIIKDNNLVYHLIRGIYDLQGISSRKKGRSKYGTYFMGF